MTFHLAGDRTDGELTRRVHEAVNADGRVFLSSIRVDGRYLRWICILSHRTHRPHVTLARIRSDAGSSGASSTVTSMPKMTPVPGEGSRSLEPMKVPSQLKQGIRRVRPEDADAVEAFRLRTFGAGSRQLDRARAAWLFDDNPLGTPGETDIWICERDGAVVGQQAEIPFELSVHGQLHAASWAVDLMVEDAWRIRGVGPALFATLLEHRPTVGAMNMSDKGMALMRGDEWSDLGVIPVYLRPLQLAEAGDLARVPARLKPLLRVAAPLFTGIDTAAGAAMGAAGLRLEPVDRFDERVDQIWDRARADHPVLARRDLKVLDWLLGQRPDRDRMQRYYLRRGEATLGYVVLRPAGTETVPTSVVVDYLAPARWVAPLLLAASHRARAEGAVALSAKTRNGKADRALRAAGFIRREQGADGPIRFVVRSADDPGLASALGRPDNWFVTSADCDLEYGMSPDGADPA